MAKTRPARTREAAKAEPRPERRARAGAPRQRLAEYEAKRDFARTPEPTPDAPPSSQEGRRSVKKEALAFCVQKHDATRLHYDVRLEIAGALMSFAVPKGPSYDPQVKRLAVET